MAAKPAPAPVATFMAPALKAGWEGVTALEGLEGALEGLEGTPVAPAVGTRGVEVTLGTTGMRGTLLLATGLGAKGVEAKGVETTGAEATGVETTVEELKNVLD